MDFVHRPVFFKNTTFLKLDLLPSSGKNNPKTETDPVSETLCFWKTLDDGQSS
jgi:hypothetical protein